MHVYASESQSATAGGSYLKFITNSDGTYSGSERVRITSSGDVGIGTTTPSAKLEVTGQVKITGGAPGLGKILTSDAAGLATWETPSGTTQWTTTGSDIYYNTGNVGIGTSSPTAPLHLSRSGGSYIQLDDTTTTSNVRLFSSGDTSYVGTVSGHKFNIRGGGVDAITIDTTGKVGIGTTTPSSPLELKISQNAQTRLKIENLDTGTAAGSDIYMTAENGAGAGRGVAMQIFGSGNTGTYSGLPLAKSARFRTDVSMNSIIIATGSASPLYLGTADQMRLTINGSGNVGIGTTTPTKSLEMEQ